jgi:nucleoside-diphosphate-sugar epimerase
MRAVVTGGAGFIGSNLVDQLIDDGHDVFVFDNLSTGDEKNINPKAWFDRHVDISNWDHNSYNPGDIIKAEGIDTIFHLAARARVQPSIEDPILFNQTNVNGTLNLLKGAVDNGVKRFVYSSSSSVYGNVECIPTPEGHPTNPLSPYGAQKLIGEIYTKTFSQVYGIETVNLRYFNVYGERQKLEGAYCLVMGKFIQQRLNGEPMTIRGTGAQRRDFTYVGDVVRANILAAASDRVGGGESINIGSGDNRSVNDIADMIGGDRINVISVLEPQETLADNRLALGLLGWKPEGNIEEWVESYKKEIGL